MARSTRHLAGGAAAGGRGEAAQGGRPLVVQTGRSAPGADPAPWPVRTFHRRLLGRTARCQRARLQSRGRPTHADPARLLRPDRPAALTRGDCRLRGGLPRGGGDRCTLRGTCQSAAGLAPSRRALGAALARRRAVRGERRVRDEQGPGQRLALSRLGDRVAQRRQALRPVREGAARRRRSRRRRRHGLPRRWTGGPREVA